MGRNDLRRTRAFIAVELGTGVLRRAAELTKKLQTATDCEVKWSDPSTMHLTLKFLGDVHRDEITKLCRIVREVAQRTQPFDLAFGGLGGFPEITNPRALWIGVREGLEEIRALQSSLDQALNEGLGFSRERKRFTPHLTIGRVHVNSASLAGLIEKHSDFEADVALIDEMVVFASTLSKHGPEHEVLGRGELGKSANARPKDDDEDEDEEFEDDDDFSDEEDFEDDDFDEDEEEDVKE